MEHRTFASLLRVPFHDHAAERRILRRRRQGAGGVDALPQRRCASVSHLPVECLGLVRKLGRQSLRQHRSRYAPVLPCIRHQPAPLRLPVRFHALTNAHCDGYAGGARCMGSGQLATRQIEMIERTVCPPPAPTIRRLASRCPSASCEAWKRAPTRNALGPNIMAVAKPRPSARPPAATIGMSGQASTTWCSNMSSGTDWPCPPASVPCGRCEGLVYLLLGICPICRRAKLRSLIKITTRSRNMGLSVQAVESPHGGPRYHPAAGWARSGQYRLRCSILAVAAPDAFRSRQQAPAVFEDQELPTLHRFHWPAVLADPALRDNGPRKAKVSCGADHRHSPNRHSEGRSPRHSPVARMVPRELAQQPADLPPRQQSF